MADQNTSNVMFVTDQPEASAETPQVTATDGETCRRYQIAGSSENLLDIVGLARKVTPTSAPVLITGESGTGKELISCMIHGESDRSDGPYIYVNCAAINESLLESELFGHEKGAFTGAHERRIGRFERADGGTLLLDEISETNPKLQAELLRVLEQQDFERVGGTDTVHVNVRVISTSNRNLAQEVTRGRFRKDLYYRLGAVHLFLPPLRERNSDIRDIVWHFVGLYASETNREITDFDEKMLELFYRYDWPGNVRQLRNVVRSALILGEGTTLSLDGVPSLVAELEQGPESETATLHLREIERRTILEALRRTQKNQAKAADLLGISDRTLREKLRRYKDAGQLQTAGEV
jgi:DNA-binding NtrC family response regulator